MKVKPKERIIVANKNQLRFTILSTMLLLLQVLTFSCKKNKTIPDDSTGVMPVITDISILTVRPNNNIRINGHNFSQNFKNSKVLFNNLPATAYQGDSTYMVVSVPDDTPVGIIALTIITNGNSIVYPLGLRVEPPVPQITGLSAEGGMRGSKLVISGNDFSTISAKNTLSINGTAVAIDSVRFSEIFVTIPQNVSTGKLTLTTHGKALTYEHDFTVVPSTFTTISDLELHDISFDAAGNIYGTNSNTVIKMTPDGTATTLATIGNSKTFLGGCVADESGNVYVSSPYNSYGAALMEYTETNSKIYKISTSGAVSVIAGSWRGSADGQGTSAQFTFPSQLALDKKTGTLYVNDGEKIRKITPTGLVNTIIGIPTTNEQGNQSYVNEITTDPKTGDLYALDGTNGLIRKVTADGSVSTLTIPPLPGTTSGSLYPSGEAGLTHMEVDASGAIFIAAGNRIYKIKGGVTSNTYLNPSTEGALGMALNSSGNIYLSGFKNSTVHNTIYAVYKITP